MNKKIIRNDLILIISLIVIAVTTLILVNILKTPSSSQASVAVNGEVAQIINLNENKDYEVKGTNGELIIRVKDGAIAVIESNCPHQDCVHIGYVSDANHPIICAYNSVVITILGQGEDDVIV